MSFLKEVLEKKNNLKPVETLVTNVLGQKIVEKKDNNGVVLIEKMPILGSGFVIDEKPDFQIAQILDYLFLGSQDSAQDETLLSNYGITHVLTIGVDLDKNTNELIKFKKIDLLDLPESSLMDVLKISIDFIDSVHNENKKNKIFVHCNAGYSRSPAIVIGYLMKTFGYSLAKSFELVNEKRKVKPNDGFMKQLVALDMKSFSIK